MPKRVCQDCGEEVISDYHLCENVRKRRRDAVYKEHSED